jgi:membrane-associated protein
MNVFLTEVLNFLEAYGYPAFGITLYIAATGVPLPAGPLLLAAGAFAAQGEFNVALLTLIATGASMCGDCTGYVVGRMWGSRVLDWLPRSRVGRHIITPEATRKSRLYFRRHGASAVFLTRWLLVWFGGATNLVAGTELYPFRSFIFWDFTGEALGAILPLALGFAFSASWEAASALMATVSLLAMALCSALLIAYYLVRHLRSAKQANAHAPMPSAEASAPAHKEA